MSIESFISRKGGRIYPIVAKVFQRDIRRYFSLSEEGVKLGPPVQARESLRLLRFDSSLNKGTIRVKNGWLACSRVDVAVYISSDSRKKGAEPPPLSRLHAKRINRGIPIEMGTGWENRLEIGVQI